MPTLSRLREGALVVFLLFAAGVNAVMFRDFFFEDAFITYRYAMNIAEGHGFVFNAGERVLGTTTPLYTLILAFLHWLGASLPSASIALYCLALSACGFFGYGILRDRGFPTAGVVFAILLAWGAGGAMRFVGMETAFYLAMIFGAMWAATTEREVSLGLLLGCIVCTRYDGVVAVALILAYRWYATGKLPVRSALAAAAVLGPWLLFALTYFGSPLPNTLGAKAADTTFLAYWADSLESQFLQFVRPLRRWGVQLEYSPTALGVGLGLLLVPPLIRGRRIGSRLWLLGAVGFFLWLAYAIISPPANHTWHLTLAVFCFLALGLAGWNALFRRQEGGRLGAWGSLALLVLAAILLPGGAVQAARQYTGQGSYRDRVWSYENIGHWILDHGLEDELLMTLEPGYIGCLTGSPVIDAAGLVTEGIRFHGPMEERDTMTSLARRFEPGLIIHRTKSVVPPSLLRDYEPVYGCRAMTLLMRRDLVTRHAEVLAAHRAEPTPRPARTEWLLRDPFLIDFEADQIPRRWALQGLARAGFGRPLPEVETGPGVFENGYLSTKRAVGKLGEFARSPLIQVNFDALAFGFGGTDPRRTRAELMIDGVTVMSLGGQGPKGSPQIGQRYFPMGAYRGKYARLKLVDVGTKQDFLVADGIRGVNLEAKLDFDDFDAGEYSDHWDVTFGKRPTPAKWLVAKGGPGLALGAFSATSLGMPGNKQMRSKPFVLERKALGFVFLDFAREASSVRLLVGGKVVRQVRGKNTRGLVPVVWPVGAWEGQTAILVVTDGDQERERWTGIDSIQFFDGYVEPALPGPAE